MTLPFAEALYSAASRSTNRLPPFSASDDNSFVWAGRGFQIVITLDQYSHEVYIALQVDGRQFREDALQRWLGLPIKALMFTDKTITQAADNVVEIVREVFNQLSSDISENLSKLDAADDELSRSSLDDQTRREAELAWDRGDAAAAAELYKSLYGRLSPLERKRVQIFEKREK